MTRMSIMRDAIVDAALERAELTSWERLRLHDVAAALAVSLNDIRAHFREKEEIVDAWFDRADAAMLAAPGRHEYALLASPERIEQALLAWLGALRPHRRVTRQTTGNKLH